MESPRLGELTTESVVCWKHVHLLCVDSRPRGFFPHPTYMGVQGMTPSYFGCLSHVTFSTERPLHSLSPSSSESSSSSGSLSSSSITTAGVPTPISFRSFHKPN